MGLNLSNISCSETGILCNLIIGTCLSDSSSKYLVLSLTIAFAASVFNVGNLLDCFGSTAGRFIDCSNFSAASCVSDFGLKTGSTAVLAVCLTGSALLALTVCFHKSILINCSFDNFDRSSLFILIG